MTADEMLAIEVFHIATLQAESDLQIVLALERDIFGMDMTEAIIRGHVPSVAVEDKEDADFVWCVYGRFRKADFPNLR